MQQDIKVNVNVQNLISCFFFTFVVSRDLGIQLCTFTFPFISSLLFLHSSGILSLIFYIFNIYFLVSVLCKCFPRLTALEPCTKTKVCSRLLIQNSYTKLQATLTVWWSPHLVTALPLCSTPHGNCATLEDQPASPTGLCVVYLAPKQVTMLCRSVVTDSQLLAMHLRLCVL